MTLTTHIRIVDPVPAEDLWRECQRLIGAPASVEWTDTYEEWTGGRRRGNRSNQGLPALLWAYYAVEQPLTFEDEPAGTPGPVFADVAIDTPYGARANDWHAWFVGELGAFLDGLGRRWTWQLEYEGSWHGADDLHLLGDRRAA